MATTNTKLLSPYDQREANSIHLQVLNSCIKYMFLMNLIVTCKYICLRNGEDFPFGA